MVKVMVRVKVMIRVRVLQIFAPRATEIMLYFLQEYGTK